MAMNDLAAFIQATPMMDTHEHLNTEASFVQRGPDVLQDLFDNYVTADLVVAGAAPDAVQRLLDRRNPDIEARLAGVRAAWERCQHTGYGQAVRLIARLVYDLPEISTAAIEAAEPRNRELRQPGGRLRLLRDMARLDHVQIDNFCWPCAPDPAGPAFFLYDISWVSFCEARIDPADLLNETGVTVTDLPSLRAAMEGIFERYGRLAVAVKSQHAYTRTLLWRERDDPSAARALQRHLAGQQLSENERLGLGDWCLARGVELAIAYDLPFKIHTGYHAGHSRMPIDWVRSGLLTDLLTAYPQARFVLMHTAWPYSAELLALAKHYPNVYMDMCWAWSIDPLNGCEFVRRAIHSVPAQKLFVFGGDSFWPSASVAYAAQARDYLTRALQAEVDEGLLTEAEAIGFAERFMRANQAECFDLERTRAALAASEGR
jgi:predicted TIM-barrel fold metal-dependent hydrolase